MLALLFDVLHVSRKLSVLQTEHQLPNPHQHDLPSSHKANYILTDHHELLEKNAFLDWDHQTIFDRERTLAEQEKRVSVLNTCVFVIVDYQPNRFFSNVQIHKDQFLI